MTPTTPPSSSEPQRDGADAPSSAERDKDTATYSQTQGGSGDVPPPNERYSRMPHERDESAAATGNRLKENPIPSDERISDAHDDIEAGRQDTDRTGIPNNIPTSKGN